MLAGGYPVNFGNGTILEAGFNVGINDNNLLVARYSDEGNFIWAVTVPEANIRSGFFSVCADNGYVYAVGQVGGGGRVIIANELLV